MSVTEETLKPSVTLISASEIENELKNALNEFNEKHKQLEDKITSLEKFISWLNVAKAQGLWKAKTCKYSNQEACEAWNISEPEKLSIPQDVIIFKQDGTKRVAVLKFPEFCVTCPLYEPKRQ